MPVTGTLVLTNGELAINKSITIFGSGPTNLIFIGISASRILNVNAVAASVLQTASLANGRPCFDILQRQPADLLDYIFSNN